MNFEAAVYCGCLFGLVVLRNWMHIQIKNELNLFYANCIENYHRIKNQTHSKYSDFMDHDMIKDSWQVDRSISI